MGGQPRACGLIRTARTPGTDLRNRCLRRERSGSGMSGADHHGRQRPGQAQQTRLPTSEIVRPVGRCIWTRAARSAPLAGGSMADGMIRSAGVRWSAILARQASFPPCPLRARSRGEWRGITVAHGHTYMAADLAPGRSDRGHRRTSKLGPQVRAMNSHPTWTVLSLQTLSP